MNHALATSENTALAGPTQSEQSFGADLTIISTEPRPRTGTIARTPHVKRGRFLILERKVAGDRLREPPTLVGG